MKITEYSNISNIRITRPKYFTRENTYSASEIAEPGHNSDNALFLLYDCVLILGIKYELDI